MFLVKVNFHSLPGQKNTQKQNIFQSYLKLYPSLSELNRRERLLIKSPDECFIWKCDKQLIKSTHGLAVTCFLQERGRK